MSTTQVLKQKPADFESKLFLEDGKIDQISLEIDKCSSDIIVLKINLKTDLQKLKTDFKSNQIAENVFKESKDKIITDFKDQLVVLKKQLKDLIDKNEQQYSNMVELKKQPESEILKKQYLEEYVALKTEYKNAQLEIKNKFTNNKDASSKEQMKKELNILAKKFTPLLKDKKDKILTTRKTIPKKIMIILLLTIAPIMLIILMSINYLVYYPANNNDASYDFGKIENIIAVILAAILIASAIIFGYFLLRDSGKRAVTERKKSFGKSLFIGFFTDFFDTIGIGSFAPTLVMLQAFGLSENVKKIPGTLNVSHTIPVGMEAAIFIASVQVEIITLVSLILCAIVGSYTGAFLANKFNTLWIKLIMGIALFLTASTMILTHSHVGVLPAGTAKGLVGDGAEAWKLPIAMVIFLILGSLMSLGVGLYAPGLATVVLLGMAADVAFPIIMGSCAFLMPVGSTKFIQDKNYYPKVSVGIAIGGTVGVATSFLLVFVGLQVGLGLSKAQFINILLWLVIVVVFYASISMMYDFFKTYKVQSKPKKLEYEKNENK